MHDDDARFEYEVEPIAEPWGESGWRAGVVVHADPARSAPPARSVYADRLFGSEGEAVAFAASQWGALGARPSGATTTG